MTPETPRKLHDPSDPVSGCHAAASRLPRTIGPYTLFEPVGRGGMAELFLARTENELGATRLAVVKLILPAFADDPKFAAMLIHEAKLAANLSHRHIVQVLDLGRADPRAPEDERLLYIAMEYVEGFDLNALLRKCSETKEGLPAPHALGIVVDILEGLDYAHRRTTDDGAPLGIVHRDVSPSNILISYEGEVKLCDFGIARANDLVRENLDKSRRSRRHGVVGAEPQDMDKSRRSRLHGVVGAEPQDMDRSRRESIEALKGKASYMSPEHARAEALDARADLFAAGIILWELLSGRRLYKPRIEMPLLEQARRAEIPPIPDKGLPDHDTLQRIVSRALAANREDRYPSAGAFQRDLEEYLANAGLLASRLRLGEWIATTFGTSVIDERRASERRLPKVSSERGSRPAPRDLDESRRSQGHGVVGAEPEDVTSGVVPAARDVVMVTQEESMPLFAPGVSLGTPATPVAIEAFPAIDTEPDVAREDPARDALARMDLASDASSSSLLQRTSPAEPNLVPQSPSTPPAKKDSDEELILWAKKRGYVSFLFFFAIAVAIGVTYFLAR